MILTPARRPRSLREAASPVVDRAEIDMRAGQPGVEAKRVLERLFRFRQAVQFELNPTEIEMRERVIGRDLHGDAESFGRIRILLQMCVGDSQVRVDAGVARIDCAAC